MAAVRSGASLEHSMTHYLRHSCMGVMTRSHSQSLQSRNTIGWLRHSSRCIQPFGFAPPSYGVSSILRIHQAANTKTCIVLLGVRECRKSFKNSERWLARVGPPGPPSVRADARVPRSGPQNITDLSLLQGSSAPQHVRVLPNGIFAFAKCCFSPSSNGQGHV